MPSTLIPDDARECSDSAPESSVRGAWYTLAVLIIVAVFAFVDRQVLALQTEQVSHSLALRDTQIGLIQGLGFATFAILATYPLGWVTDRFDRRFVLSGLIIVWSGGTAACGFAQGFWSLFVAVMAISAGEAALPALAYSAIPDLFVGKRRLLANQVFYIALILSSAVGIGFGGAANLALAGLKGSLPAMLDGFEPWRIVFLLVSAPGLILICLVAASRLDLRSANPAQSTIELGSNLGIYMRKHGWTAALIVTACSFSGLPFLAVLTWTPAALTRLFGVTPSQNGLGLGMGLALGCIVGVALAGWLMRRLLPRLGDRAAIRIAFGTLLASLPLAILYAFVANEWQGYFMVGALMASGTLNGSLLPGILQGLAPPELRGRIVALYGIMSVVTSGIGVSLIGSFSDQFSHEPRALLIGVAVLLTVAWIIGAVLMRLSEAPFARLLAEFGDPER